MVPIVLHEPSGTEIVEVSFFYLFSSFARNRLVRDFADFSWMKRQICKGIFLIFQWLDLVGVLKFVVTEPILSFSF